MSLLINSQNIIPVSLSPPEELPAPKSTLSSENFISKAIHIVKTSAQARDVDQIAASLQALKEEYAEDPVSTATLRVLIEQIKGIDVCAEHLPIIYRHLILDLQVEINDLSTCNQEFRIAKAKLAAQQDSEELCEHIQDYGITSQAALIDIAKIAAQENGFALSASIQNYGITSQEALVEIAKIAARQSGSGVSLYIENYGITSQKALIEIAKLAAWQNAKGVSKYIQNYGIKNERALIAIAKLAAAQSGEGVSELIKNYGIKNERALREIAEIAARQSRQGISEHIQNYGIRGQQDLAEIALLDIQQQIERNSPFINVRYILAKYSLSIPNTIWVISILVNMKPEIAKEMRDLFRISDHQIILKQYPELRVFNFDSSDYELKYLSEMLKVTDPYSEKRATLYREMMEEQNPKIKAIKKNSLHMLCSIVDFAKGSPSLLKNLIGLFESVARETNPQVHEQKLVLMASLLMHCRAKNVDQAALDKQFFLLNEAFALKDPSLRSHLSHALIENLTNPAVCAFCKKHLSQKSSTNLVLTLLAPFITQMVPYVELQFSAKRENDREIRYVPFIERMKELLDHKVFSKNHSKTVSLLRSLYTLVNTCHLSKEEKVTVLRDLIFAGQLIAIKDLYKKEQCEQLFQSAEAVDLLIKFKEFNRLLSITPEQLHNQFKQLLAIGLKIDAPENLIINTIGKWRKPDSLLMYAGKLSSLPTTREKVLPFLQQFATSVIYGTYAVDRYDSSKASEHWLKAIENMTAEQIEKWKKGSAYVDDGFDVVDTHDPCDLLLSGTDFGSCQAVDADPALSKSLVAYLLDPKIRMLAIKNKQGVTVARCMMRLLWDKTTQKFVLFQERKYPVERAPYYFGKMLDRACKKRAEELGLALLNIDAQEGQKTTLQAFRGKVPFEYVDGLGFNANQTDAGYEISGCKYIYQPEK